MTVANDASTASSFTTTSPATFNHTPAGTPRAVLVAIAHGVESTDLITGAVSYGGVAMTRVPTNGFAQDTADEPGCSYLYFLGAGIPTGTQSVSITHSGSATTKTGYAVTFTAAADCEIGASGRLQENQANPQVALDTGATSSLRLGAIYSGIASPTNVVDLTGQTTLKQTDFGAFVAKISSQDTAATGSVTFGWTATSDDVAAVFAAIREISASTQNLTGALFTKAPTFNTGVITSVRNLAGVLFAKAPTFNTGAITTGAITVTGNLFTKAPTFNTGAVTSVRALTGVLFTKTPTFNVGAITATFTLTGVLFTKAPTFPQGVIATLGAPQTVNGVLFTKAPTFPTGALNATYALTGTLFTKAPTFNVGAVISGVVTLTGALFTEAPTFPQGVITTGAVSVTGVLFTKTPTFFAGTVTTTVTLTGVLFQKVPTFPIGTIGQAGTLFGILFTKTPTFFSGTVGQIGGSFWRPFPVHYTLNPVAYTPVGPNDVPPWATQIIGEPFEKAPTFLVGSVS